MRFLLVRFAGNQGRKRTRQLYCNAMHSTPHAFFFPLLFCAGGGGTGLVTMIASSRFFSGAASNYGGGREGRTVLYFPARNFKHARSCFPTQKKGKKRRGVGKSRGLREKMKSSQASSVSRGGRSRRNKKTISEHFQVPQKSSGKKSN